MTDQTYKIYYHDGLKSDVTEQDAVSKLAALLKISEDNARKMIRATNRIVKGGLSYEQAQKYFNALDQLGMQVEIQQQQDRPASLEAIDRTIERDESSLPDTPAAPEDAAEKVTESNQGYKSIAVEFHGKGFEYFKIWIVNIFLTIITLGIYSAWAKVRNKRYFYGNTQIDGSSFHYTATPITILKGRLIAVGVFIIYTLINQFIPLLGLVLALAFLIILPWLIVRSLAFNARNSVYRNIRFDFTGKALDALKAYVLWPLLIVPTLGLIMPLVWAKQQRFMVSNSAYGSTGFTFHAEARDYFRFFFIALGSLLAVGLLIGLLSFLIGPQLMLLLGPFSAIVYFILFAYIVVSLGNLFFNFSNLNSHGFVSTLETGKMAWIYITNTLAIVFSLGLLIPWAKVRMARYRAECLTLQVDGSLDEFIAAEQQKVSALGEEMGEVFDIDVSFI